MLIQVASSCGVIVDSIDVEELSQFSSACIAGAIKKYLRELPEPVIPTQFYKEFVQCASKCAA